MGRARIHRKWYAGETISVAIGQGAVTTTPLQLARMIGGIASGGVFKQPHMIKDALNVGEQRVPISEPTVEKVTDAMYGVVNESGGTGTQFKLAGVELSGKSGTAQVIGYDTRIVLANRKNLKTTPGLSATPPNATRKSSSPYSSRKAVSMEARRPVQSFAISLKPITTRKIARLRVPSRQPITAQLRHVMLRWWLP